MKNTYQKIPKDSFESSKKFASVLGLIVNFVLAASKIAAGVLFNLVSVIADGVNNLSDGGSCLIALVSYKISAKPADNSHPFGHQRAEYVATMCIAFLIVALGAELFREALSFIITPKESETNFIVFLVLSVSIFLKCVLFILYRKIGKKTHSDVLLAASVDCACDCLSTLAALLGAVLCANGINADGYVGLLVALFILYQGLKILLEESSKLLGQAPSKELLSSLKQEILQNEGVLGLHDLKVYPFGPHKIFSTVHIETDASMPALLSHEILDGIERKVKEKFGVELTAHLDPVAVDDKEAEELKEKIFSAVDGIVENMDLHDFRLVRGARDKVLFEVGVPFSCPMRDEEILSSIVCAVKMFGDFEPIITVERE